MTTINMVPVNRDGSAVRLTSRAFSMILLCLAAHGFVNLNSDCCDFDSAGTVKFQEQDIPLLAKALSEICSQMIDAGLRDIAIETAFLLSVLPSSGGMHAEMIDV